MNSKRNIYELSKQIEQEEEDKAYEIQARKIANAYRQVEQIKVTKHPLPPPKDEPTKPKQPSTYAIKIKETLKEINANKTKMQQNLHRNIPQKVEEQGKRAPTKLQRAGATKLFRVAETYCQRMTQASFQFILQRGREEEKKEDIFIRKFRIFKIFRAWKNEAIMIKMQRKRNSQEDEMGSLKANELAKEFHAFVILKKAYKGWNAEAKKEIKRKKYEAELRRQQVAEKLKIKEEKKSPKTSIVPKNAELQNKVRGFLDGLKDKIEHKDRLNTIKEKTEESDMRIKLTEQSLNQSIQEHEESAENEQEDETSSNQAIQGNSQRVIQPPEPQPSVEKKNLTNQELLKKRKELELKSKSRKQTLEKLRKEKEEKQKEEERKIAEIEKEIQQEQKKIKQEKYKQYVKNKQDQQEWQKREKQIEIQAGEFNRYRLLKYYGWKPLSSLRVVKKKNGDQLYQTLLLILYRVKATTFLQSLQSTAQQSLQNQYQRMQKRYRLNLLHKTLQAFNHCCQQESQKKVEYAIMHQVNTLKIFFACWKRTIPQLTVENFEWQRPRNKRAHQFHRIQLLHKAFSALHSHKLQSQRARNLASHKTRIQNKLKSLLEQQETMNYQQFL